MNVFQLKKLMLTSCERTFNILVVCSRNKSFMKKKTFLAVILQCLLGLFPNIISHIDLVKIHDNL